MTPQCTAITTTLTLPQVEAVAASLDMDPSDLTIKLAEAGI